MFTVKVINLNLQIKCLIKQWEKCSSLNLSPKLWLNLELGLWNQSEHHVWITLPIGPMQMKTGLMEIALQVFELGLDPVQVEGGAIQVGLGKPTMMIAGMVRFFLLAN